MRSSKKNHPFIAPMANSACRTMVADPKGKRAARRNSTDHQNSAAHQNSVGLAEWVQGKIRHRHPRRHMKNLAGSVIAAIKALRLMADMARAKISVPADRGPKGNLEKAATAEVVNGAAGPNPARAAGGGRGAAGR